MIVSSYGIILYVYMYIYIIIYTYACKPVYNTGICSIFALQSGSHVHVTGPET